MPSYKTVPQHTVVLISYPRKRFHGHPEPQDAEHINIIEIFQVAARDAERAIQNYYANPDFKRKKSQAWAQGYSLIPIIFTGDPKTDYMSFFKYFDEHPNTWINIFKDRLIKQYVEKVGLDLDDPSILSVVI